MADFIVSGQIPGTQFQITFYIWSVLIIGVVGVYAARASYRSNSFRAWVITTRIMMAVHSRRVTQA